MRAVFAEKTKDDRVTVAEGTFESVDVEDGWADVVVIAQVNLLRPPTGEKKVKRCALRRSIGAQTTRRLP